MLRRSLLAAAWGAVLPAAGALCGCAGRPSGADTAAMTELVAASRRKLAMNDAGVESLKQKHKLSTELLAQPDLPEWHAQRETMALAIGDRTFDKAFDRVFDSMTVALSTLGSRVNNMERGSGYITASIPSLGPTRTAGLQRAALRHYAAAKGYPPSVLEKSADDTFDYDVESHGGVLMRHAAGLTLQLVRQGAGRTKVKLRFDNVYYPEFVAEYYRLVWTAVDKQMFLDQSLD